MCRTSSRLWPSNRIGSATLRQNRLLVSGSVSSRRNRNASVTLRACSTPSASSRNVRAGWTNKLASGVSTPSRIRVVIDPDFALTVVQAVQVAGVLRDRSAPRQLDLSRYEMFLPISPRANGVCRVFASPPDQRDQNCNATLTPARATKCPRPRRIEMSPSSWSNQWRRTDGETTTPRCGSQTSRFSRRSHRPDRPTGS